MVQHRCLRRAASVVGVALTLVIAGCGLESDPLAFNDPDESGSVVETPDLVEGDASGADDDASTATSEPELGPEDEAGGSDELGAAPPVPTGPTAPLTGQPVDDPALASRSALAIKIDNHVSARPQWGLLDADIVFDYRAEGVTRFMAVYHSQLPETIGPVRSSRTSDFDLLTALGTPLYASSGGNDIVMSRLRSVDAVAVTDQTESAYYRTSGRPAPHNLVVDPRDLYAAATGDGHQGAPPPAWFEFRNAEGASAEVARGAAVSTAEVEIDFTGSPTVRFEWDAAQTGWIRLQDGQLHVAAESGEPLAPRNVVIMVTDYRTSSADAASPELVSVGSGAAYALVDGRVIEGTWSRLSPADTPTLTDLDDEQIVLAPGQTWVLFPQPGQVTIFD
ncbi:MAG: DUF3048 domain-containing protein [Actinomycetota bacterium]